MQQANLYFLPVKVAVKAQNAGFAPEILIFKRGAKPDIGYGRIKLVFNNGRRSVNALFGADEARFKMLVYRGRAHKPPAVVTVYNSQLIAELPAEHCVGKRDIAAFDCAPDAS